MNVLSLARLASPPPQHFYLAEKGIDNFKKEKALPIRSLANYSDSELSNALSNDDELLSLIKFLEIINL